MRFGDRPSSQHRPALRALFSSTTPDGVLRARLEAHPGEAYGLFAPADPVQQLPLERAAACDALASALHARESGQRVLDAANDELRVAVRGAHAYGARVTQLAAIVDVSRPTIYAWLDGADAGRGVPARSRRAARGTAR